MQRTRFNDGWSFRPKVNPFEELVGGAEPFAPVVLPHDAMIATTRQGGAPAANGFFPGGSWEYQKAFPWPAADAGLRVHLHFEGVYRSALVKVNGARVGQRPYGYSGFTVRIDEHLRPGEENVVHVEATAGDDSRWYSGGGIYRNVHLLVGEPVRIAVDGLRVTTTDVDDDRAVVEVSTLVHNDSTSPARRSVEVEVLDPAGAVVGRSSSPVTTWPGKPQPVRQRIVVSSPERWSIEQPAMHTCVVRLLDEARTGDVATTTFGIRTIDVDPERGFRLNGREVKLRGACVHHDNGVIGAATIERAEERRVELLKAAGFNALRSAHHPMSEAMLDACDRLGVLVMDEAFDAWTEPKTTNDYARSFTEWWAADIASMVAKDVNHPSVVLYSIGNEIQDLGRPDGARHSRELAELVRALDPTRFVTNALQPILACGPEIFADPDVPMPELGVNSLMTIMQEYLPQVLRSEKVAAALEESAAALDVVGYNYTETCYELDRERFPNRVMVGSETMPPMIGRYWRLVRDNPYVIGDFTWTGWDYLGEAGIGRVDREVDGRAPAGLHATYPWLTAGPGDLDITGHRRPISYLREIAYGLRTDPYLAVVDPVRHGSTVLHRSPWTLTDGIASWTWPGREGQVTRVEVFADGDEVELLIDGAVVGRAPAGEAVEYQARFETTYAPGTIEAVAYRDGTEIGRTTLRTAGSDVGLRLRADRDELSTDGRDLAFVTVELVDTAGVVHTATDRPVTVAVEGSGTLLGFGSAAPSSEESFVDNVHRTHEGRALAVVRPTGPGTIEVVASAEGGRSSSVVLRAG